MVNALALVSNNSFQKFYLELHYIVYIAGLKTTDLKNNRIKIITLNYRNFSAKHSKYTTKINNEKDHEGTYFVMKVEKLEYPAHVSAQAVSFIDSLIKKNPE